MKELQLSFLKVSVLQFNVCKSLLWRTMHMVLLQPWLEMHIVYSLCLFSLLHFIFC